MWDHVDSMWVPCGPIWGPDGSKMHRNRATVFFTNRFVWQSIVLICLAIDVASFLCHQSVYSHFGWQLLSFAIDAVVSFACNVFFQPICAAIGLCCNHFCAIKLKIHIQNSPGLWPIGRVRTSHCKRKRTATTEKQHQPQH